MKKKWRRRIARTPFNHLWLLPDKIYVVRPSTGGRSHERVKNIGGELHNSFRTPSPPQQLGLLHVAYRYAVIGILPSIFSTSFPPSNPKGRKVFMNYDTFRMEYGTKVIARYTLPCCLFFVHYTVANACSCRDGGTMPTRVYHLAACAVGQ